VSRDAEGHREYRLRLEVDGEGVVRCFACDGTEALQVTPQELGQLLTGLLKAVLADDDNDNEQTFSLN
jgi:hypothetical protein